jgi:5'-AMP-activated protein kinase regulatory beta subunit
VDDSWRCSKQISTATDDDGTLVNWIEVEAARSDEEMKAEWSSEQPVTKSVDGEFAPPPRVMQNMVLIPY